jgi:hypothetical protein
MKRNVVKDGVTKQPVIDATTGKQKTNVYIGVAIPKGGESHWNQTDWGQKLYQVAQAGWPRGEFQNPIFAWKIVDGDSETPNQSGTVPNKKEGFPGHWVLNCATQFFVNCHYPNKYDPTQQIQNEKEIKAGDYCRVLLSVKDNCNPNLPNQTPGIYLNPQLFELSRAGQEIILSKGPSAADAFGGSPAVIPPNAQLDNAVQQPPAAMQPPVNAAAPPPPVNVAPLPPPVHNMTALANGQSYEQLIELGWTDESLISNGLIINTSPGITPAPGILTGQ